MSSAALHPRGISPAAADAPPRLDRQCPDRRGGSVFPDRRPAQLEVLSPRARRIRVPVPAGRPGHHRRDQRRSRPATAGQPVLVGRRPGPGPLAAAMRAGLPRRAAGARPARGTPPAGQSFGELGPLESDHAAVAAGPPGQAVRGDHALAELDVWRRGRPRLGNGRAAGRLLDRRRLGAIYGRHQRDLRSGQLDLVDRLLAVAENRTRGFARGRLQALWRHGPRSGGPADPPFSRRVCRRDLLLAFSLPLAADSHGPGRGLRRAVSRRRGRRDLDCACRTARWPICVPAWWSWRASRRCCSTRIR